MASIDHGQPNPIQDLVEKGDPRSIKGRHRLDRIFRLACLGITSFAVIALVVLLTSIILRGASTLSWNFLTGATSSYAETASVKVSLWGSIWVCISIVHQEGLVVETCWAI